MRTGAVNSASEDRFDVPHEELRFADRHDAGRRLASICEPLRSQRPIVIAIPRGGVPVAAEVARALAAPLDVIVVRKVGAPWQPEYAIGAVAEGGVRIIARDDLSLLGISPRELEGLVAAAERELEERRERYRGRGGPPEVRGRTVLLVDDGLATGRTARAAAHALRERGAARIVLAVPVAAAQSLGEMEGVVDEILALQVPEQLLAVGFWYDDFSPTGDDEVAALLRDGRAGPGVEAGERTTDATARERNVDAGAGVRVPGTLTLPRDALGIVAFAHGSGSSRMSPRNRQVAEALHRQGFATLLFDLLTADEELDRANVFDIPLLAARLVAATAWLGRQPETAELPLGLFGASTGAAAALIAAADLGPRIGAVVSRGGRPDLAAERLGEVTAPTLLIVGGHDIEVLELNRRAQRRLRCENDLEVVPGATHLFEEPGALETVSALAIDWFRGHLRLAAAGS